MSNFISAEIPKNGSLPHVVLPRAFRPHESVTDEPCLLPAGHSLLGKAEIRWAACALLRRGNNPVKGSMVILLWVFCSALWHCDNLAICLVEVAQLHQRDNIISVDFLEKHPCNKTAVSRVHCLAV